MKYIYLALLIFLHPIFGNTTTNDSSKLNKTSVTEIIRIQPGTMAEQLRKVLLKAASLKTSVTLKGSQHTQGGHTFIKNGILLDFQDCKHIKQISDSVIRIQCGATWKDVLDYLQPKGLSVHIMQSNFDFSVGGTLSTNVHGWQLNTPPLVESIQGFHLLLADGSIVYCTRNLFPDLFAATIGGYGLLGVVLDIDLRVIPNKMYELNYWVTEIPSFVPIFQDILTNPKAHMFFGRFNLDHDNFLKQLSITTYNETNKKISTKPLKESAALKKITSWIFKKTYNNNFFRKMRWKLENAKLTRMFVNHLPRNQLLYHSANHYLSDEPNTVDLLQEYFIPTENFEKFVDVLQNMQNELEPHLMNITLRQVNKDHQTLLNYTSTDRLCFVMFFRGPNTKIFDKQIEKVSQELTDHALTLNGTYYLPYRPYQTKEQFQKAYPSYQEFKKLKIKYDPKLIFKNQFYENYFQ
ncbi:MAG: FAD-binding oxidoreductase [Candidatus Paracaedibacteraceae bacterium]|nr:FAD-binding oxidoreductase [Candidatus Paracaedibacteraceae bacterium]